MRLAVVGSLVLWPGATILLAEQRGFRRRGLVERLQPYSRAGSPLRARRDVLSVATLVEVIGPLARTIGEAVSRLFGVTEELAVRLAKAHAPWDTTGFRMRQLGACTLGLGAGGAGYAWIGPPPLAGVLMLLGTPLLVFLVMEQRITRRSDDWRRAVFLELPVVCEQLAMLVSAGYSLGTAIDRIAHRADGACARDLRAVVDRVAQGLAIGAALREWSDVVRLDALDRLVAVLGAHDATTDLGRLITEEAASVRRDVHRELIETLDRRAQSVWIPVTVATLVPGVILLAIPFAHALRLFTSGSP
ncbi:MAG: type II secretion system F family protein [Acidimicrobiales bacterium]